MTDDLNLHVEAMRALFKKRLNEKNLLINHFQSIIFSN